MPKRKREQYEQLAQRNAFVAHLRLQQRFERGVRELQRALKAARGFERQKLGRRRKNASEADVPKIESEVAALKVRFHHHTSGGLLRIAKLIYLALQIC